MVEVRAITYSPPREMKKKKIKPETVYVSVQTNFNTTLINGGKGGHLIVLNEMISTMRDKRGVAYDPAEMKYAGGVEAGLHTRADVQEV